MRSRVHLTAAWALLGVALLLGSTGCKSRKQTSATKPPPYSVSNEPSDPTSTMSSAAVPSASPSAASSASDDEDGTSHMGRGTGPVFETADGRYRVRTPGFSLEKSKHEANVLRVADKNSALNVYEEKKIDFKPATIDEFINHELAAKKRDTQSAIGPVTKLTVAGRPARQSEVDVVIDDDRWRELFTVIDFPDEWLEVSVVVKPSKYDRAKANALVQTVEPTGNK